jgi:hypothetical protein
MGNNNVDVGDDYDYSGVTNLFDMTQSASNANYGNAGMSVFGDTSMGDSATLLGNTGVTDDTDFATWLMQSDPELAKSLGMGGEVNDFGQTAEDGGILKSIGNGFKNLGPAGQMVLGSAAAGGLSTYLQNRQRDQELANMSQMSEDQFNRALTLKKAPTNKVANLNHFQGMIKSLRSGQ